MQCFFNQIEGLQSERKTGQDDVQAQLMKELTSFEAHLLMTQEVVEIRGKVCK